LHYWGRQCNRAASLWDCRQNWRCTTPIPNEPYIAKLGDRHQRRGFHLHHETTFLFSFGNDVRRFAIGRVGCPRFSQAMWDAAPGQRFDQRVHARFVCNNIATRRQVMVRKPSSRNALETTIRSPTPIPFSRTPHPPQAMNLRQPYAMASSSKLAAIGAPTPGWKNASR